MLDKLFMTVNRNLRRLRESRT